jgi:ABC-type polysaccharide/polyol phosphate transport system ATPase subunit
VISLSASDEAAMATASRPRPTSSQPEADASGKNKKVHDPSAPPAVKVQDVSVTYRTTWERRPTLKEAMIRFGRGERAVREVEALKHVSFTVPEGTALGIVGANGAGKSTLIRTIGGILPPTEGRIEVHGRISALLALGVGFNPSLSGRENVILGGLASGLTRAQIAERSQEIEDFAEIGEFMDMPIRTYSSGMRSRLAFSVAVHMEPDILMIDEAMSAGDARFKQKAAAKMQELMQSARAMFLVSHALASIEEICNRAIWLHKGDLMLEGEPREVIDAYTEFIGVKQDRFTQEDL